MSEYAEAVDEWNEVYPDKPLDEEMAAFFFNMGRISLHEAISDALQKSNESLRVEMPEAEG